MFIFLRPRRNVFPYVCIGTYEWVISYRRLKASEEAKKLRLDSVLDFRGVLHLMWLQGALRPRRWAAAGGGRGWGLTGSLFPDVLASAYTSLECHEAYRYIVASGTRVWERR